MDNFYSYCELIMIIVSVILTMMILSTRDLDENGMDSYDKMWGIAGEGYTRNHWGQIHKDGEYDLWANLMDHNPYFNN